MKENASLSRIILIVSIMSLFALLRVFIEIPNVHPIAAIALFGGTFIQKKWQAIVFPLAVLLMSDLVLGFYTPFLMAFVYGSFVLITLLGFWLRNRVKVQNVVAASLMSSLVFFTMTNLAVWAEGLWYPMTLSGLGECFALAIPFFKTELAGTLMFTLAFFGIYQLAISRIRVFKTA